MAGQMEVGWQEEDSDAITAAKTQEGKQTSGVQVPITCDYTLVGALQAAVQPAGGKQLLKQLEHRCGLRVLVGGSTRAARCKYGSEGSPGSQSGQSMRSGSSHHIRRQAAAASPPPNPHREMGQALQLGHKRRPPLVQRREAERVQGAAQRGQLAGASDAGRRQVLARHHAASEQSEVTQRRLVRASRQCLQGALCRQAGRARVSRQRCGQHAWDSGPAAVAPRAATASPSPSSSPLPPAQPPPAPPLPPPA